MQGTTSGGPHLPNTVRVTVSYPLVEGRVFTTGFISFFRISRLWKPGVLVYLGLSCRGPSPSVSVRAFPSQDRGRNRLPSLVFHRISIVLSGRTPIELRPDSRRPSVYHCPGRLPRTGPWRVRSIQTELCLSISTSVLHSSFRRGTLVPSSRDDPGRGRTVPSDPHDLPGPHDSHDPVSDTSDFH